MKRHLLVTVIGLAALTAVGCGTQAEVDEYVAPITNVEYYTIEEQTFRSELSLPIVVMPQKEVNLGLTNGGRVTALHVDKGDRVTTGQVLLETDTTLLAAQLKNAQAILDYQQNECARAETLCENGSITEAQLDAARLALAQAETGVAIATKQLEDATLTAPFAGTVTMRNAEIGDMLSPGASAFRIIDMSRVKVQAGIPEKYIRDFSIGSRVAIRLDAIPDREFDAEISFISPEADSRVRTFLVEMMVNNQGGQLRAGLMGNAHITQTPIEHAIMIPLNTIIETQTGPIVFVLKDDDTAEMRSIRTLNANNRMMLIEGVNAGEKIIARGHNNLTDGEQVNVTGPYALNTGENME